MSTEFTPMMQQYLSIKRRMPQTILFFRMGDFYEMFFDDAKLASRVLDLTLTARDGGKGKKVPMAGVPHHASEGYIGRLVKAGYRVAICEQVEDPKVTKGLVKREVVRTITPGTAVSASILDQKDNNYMASIYQAVDHISIASVDVSTGEFQVGRLSSIDDLLAMIQRYQIKEILLSEDHAKESQLARAISTSGALVTAYDAGCFIADLASSCLCEHFHVQNLEGLLGRDIPDSLICAAGAMMTYLKEMHRESLGHINTIKIFSLSDMMLIDAATERNLELVRNLRNQGREHTLLSVLDDTLTAMGGRLLKSWILNPLVHKDAITERLDCVSSLHQDILCKDALRDKLRHVGDLERIVGRLECGQANARDMVGLASSCEMVHDIARMHQETSSPILRKYLNRLPSFTEMCQTIRQALLEEPAISLKDGHLIRPGFNQDLDELKSIASGGKEWIRNLQHTEIERTGVRSLKVRYNKVFGYYIEMTKSNLSAVPEDYIRKQTLVNSERFITPELKEKEALVLGAQERIARMEFDIFMQVREHVRGFITTIQEAARIISQLDVYASLAHVAIHNSYVRPHINEDETIEIQEGRHPVVEGLLDGETFIPNDTHLNHDTSQLIMITGPNMAGKSTYIRQVALIVLMAQMGSFVPATRVTIGLVDRIFTRVGASDELARGQSTFMVEMTEVAHILNHATSKSLLILDEVGRGTSTFDGVSIAWAVAEYIHSDRLGARALFATHYHELTELELLLKKVKNYNIAVREWKDEIIFLRKIIPGGTDKSYGIHVARLAGLPHSVIARAKDILANLEKASVDDKGLPSFINAREIKSNHEQLTSFQDVNHPVLAKIEHTDVNHMTPMQALQFLSELKNEMDKVN